MYNRTLEKRSLGLEPASPVGRQKQRSTSFANYQSDPDGQLVLPHIQSSADRCRSTYIADAEERVKITEKLLASDPKAHIRIDGGYGDYSMSIFRVKDRRRWQRDVPTLFSNRVKESIIGSFPTNTMDEKTLQQIISKPRSTTKQAQSDRVVTDKNEETTQAARRSQLDDVEDNMNGYLMLKQYPHQPVKFSTPSRQQVDSSECPSPQNKTNSGKKDNRLSSRLRTKDYMFRALAKLQKR